MEKEFNRVSGFLFTFENKEQEYDDEISTYNEMIVITRNLYREITDLNIKVKMLYKDVDELVEFQSQNEYAQILSYHIKKCRNEKVRIQLVKEEIKISSVLASKFVLAESNLVDNMDSLMPKTKTSLLNDQLKEIECKQKYTMTREYNSELFDLRNEMENLKEVVKDSKDEMKMLIQEMMKTLSDNFDNKINKVIGRIPEYIQNKMNKVENVISLEIVEQQEANLEDPSIFTNDENSIKSDLNNFEDNSCRSCNFFQAEFICGVCDNFYICSECCKNRIHVNHPLIIMCQYPHFRIENLSKTNFESAQLTHNNSFLYDSNNIMVKNLHFKNNKNYFSNKSPLKITLQNNNASTCFNLKRGEKVKFPFEITNNSNIAIEPAELLITTKNNGLFFTESRLVENKIKKNEKYLNYIEFQAPLEIKLYEFDIILIHANRKIEYDPVRIFVQVI